ncbi:MAG: hypothetical protein ACREA7_07885 [Nitrosotalea sp.]
MTKASAYTRDLTQKEIKVLQAKYEPYLKKASRNRGFIPLEKTKRLLHITNWEEDTSSNDVYQFFSDLKSHTRTSFGDIQLICDTLKPSVLNDIFRWEYPEELNKQLSHEADPKKSQDLHSRVPTIENVVKALLFSKEEKEEKPDEIWKHKGLVLQPDAWKFNIASNLIRICFEFLQENKFITSKSHERLIEEVTDMINAESHNLMVPKFWRNVQWA